MRCQASLKPFNDSPLLSLKGAPNIHSVHSKKCSYTWSSLNPRGVRSIDVKKITSKGKEGLYDYRTIKDKKIYQQ